jgi:hypothetical protein
MPELQGNVPKSESGERWRAIAVFGNGGYSFPSLSQKPSGYSVENSWLRGDHGFEGYTVTQSFNTPRQPVDEMFASMFIKVIAS